MAHIEVSEAQKEASWGVLTRQLQGVGDDGVLHFIRRTAMAGDVVSLVALRDNLLAWTTGETAHARLHDPRGTYQLAKAAIDSALAELEGDN